MAIFKRIVNTVLHKKNQSPENMTARQKMAMQNVATLANSKALSIDRGNDGIPDYLQRENLPSLVKAIGDTTLAHVDAQREVERILMDWRGYEFDPNKSEYVPVSPPMINELGIRQLGQFLHVTVNKLTINSNISEDWCHSQTLRISYTVSYWLEDNQKLWGIRDSDLSPLVEQIDSFIFLILSRAIADGQRQHDTKRLSLTGNNTGGNAPVI